MNISNAKFHIQEPSQEAKMWRWLYWSNRTGSWACPCGHAHGKALDKCNECGIERPRAGYPVTALRASGERAGEVTAAMVEALLHREIGSRSGLESDFDTSLRAVLALYARKETP